MFQQTNRTLTTEKEFVPELSIRPGETAALAKDNREVSDTGSLIVNADDWGRDCETTGRILDCVMGRTVSSVSGMVFMADSERAAAIAQEYGIDAGLHLNLTTAFSMASAPQRLVDHQERLSRYLSWHRFGHVVFHPGLANSFAYVVAAQLEEFRRLYGRAADRIDGHHHAHLCANVLFGKLLPEGAIVRRNFSFRPREKSLANRLYRGWVDGRLARRHRLVDYFFALEPVESTDRLGHIFPYARHSVVEIETHPINPNEYRFLRHGEIFRRCGDIAIASHFALPRFRHAANETEIREVPGVSGDDGLMEERGGHGKTWSSTLVRRTSAIHRTPRATVLVGFAEAATAAEVVWSLVDKGYEVIAFARKGRASALRHSRHVVCHEICAPETDLEAALSDLRSLMISVNHSAAGVQRTLFPLDDKAVLLCSRVQIDDDWLLAGPRGAHAELALDKQLQTKVAGSAGFNVPKTALVRTANDIRNFIAAESYPIILKSANCVPTEAGRANTCPQWICANDGELERALREWGERLPLLAQPFIVGTGEGIFGLAAPDGIRAWSAHRRLRMMNPQGSGSSACISLPVSEDLRCNAEDFIQQTGWQGMFMIELLRDRMGTVFFVEFNGRPWGSMALSRRQHLEYPAWQVMLAADPHSQGGKTASPIPGTISRHAGRELMHLLFVLRGPKSTALSDWPSMWKSVMEVFRSRPAETLYNWRREDKKVFLADVGYTIKSNLFKNGH
jgi:predicted ATP-grasp superfamily ATP-dependent carboligase